MNPTAHLDTFTRDNLPPESQRPVFLNTLPALEFPAQLNCVEPLLDRHIREGRGDRPAVRSLTERWTYADLA
ncbi:MAG: 2-aminobenzoate-CoA ligase, partial [Pseudomonadota bacterium]